MDKTPNGKQIVILPRLLDRRRMALCLSISEDTFDALRKRGCPCVPVVGTAKILFDPDAVVKLRDKLIAMEARREAMKYLNSHWRKHGELPQDVSPELAAKAKAHVQFSSGGTEVPFPAYEISNLGQTSGA